MIKGKDYTDRYHSDIYMPNGLQEECIWIMKKFAPHRFSSHAIEHLSKYEDRSHKVNTDLLKKALYKLETEPVKPFEIYTDKGGYPVRFCMRTEMSARESVVFVVQRNIIITFYVNDKFDHHNTLDYSLYSRQ